MHRQKSSVSPSSALGTALRQQREVLEEIRSQQRALRAALDRLFDSLSKRIDEYEQHMMLRFSEVDVLLRAAIVDHPQEDGERPRTISLRISH